MNRPLSAGSTIETQCTRCRMLTNHTIVAMVGEKVVRVECNTCHSIHNYRSPKAAKEPVAARTTQKKPVSTPRTPRVDPEAAARSEWLSLQPDMDPAKALPYDMTGTYRMNSLILHSQFGLGVVQLVLPGKIEVLFQDGKKRLRCA